MVLIEGLNIYQNFYKSAPKEFAEDFNIYQNRPYRAPWEFTKGFNTN